MDKWMSEWLMDICMGGWIKGCLCIMNELINGLMDGFCLENIIDTKNNDDVH